jgi:hypothetical protein
VHDNKSKQTVSKKDTGDELKQDHIDQMTVSKNVTIHPKQTLPNKVTKNLQQIVSHKATTKLLYSRQVTSNRCEVIIKLQ